MKNLIDRIKKDLKEVKSRKEVFPTVLKITQSDEFKEVEDDIIRERIGRERAFQSEHAFAFINKNGRQFICSVRRKDERPSWAMCFPETVDDLVAQILRSDDSIIPMLVSALACSNSEKEYITQFTIQTLGKVALDRASASGSYQVNRT